MSMQAEVKLWGSTIGAVALEDGAATAMFEYNSAFAGSGIEVSPLMMPLSSRLYSFPALRQETFNGLPGLLADSLPDRFGNALIDAWLARQGRTPESFNAVERLCYTERANQTDKTEVSTEHRLARRRTEKQKTPNQLAGSDLDGGRYRTRICDLLHVKQAL